MHPCAVGTRRTRQGTDRTTCSPTRRSAGGPVPLTAPRDGTPRPVETADELAEVVARLAAGTGPVAVDAERASGYRYSQRAYLVQLRRAGAGTVLIDPLPLADLRTLDEAIADTEWVLHAASQDLPCLAELGMRPRRLFDTELAARLAGFERVGLAALTEQLLGFTLEKHHSAADWSTRPLPAAWLTYAALDVELLVELRDALGRRAGPAGQAGLGGARSSPRWSPAPAGRRGPRPTRGAARPASTGCAAPARQSRVRALWDARDGDRRAAATRRPGRVLPDAAIVAAAEAGPEGRADAAARCPASAAARCAGSPGSGSTRWTRPGRCPTTSCR